MRKTTFYSKTLRLFGMIFFGVLMLTFATACSASNPINQIKSFIDTESSIDTEHSYEQVNLGGQDYYLISEDTSWSGDHRCESLDYDPRAEQSPDTVMEVMSYQDYKNTLEKVKATIHASHLICADYDDQNTNYLVVVDPLPGAADANMKVHDFCIKNGKIILYASSHSGGYVAGGYVAITVIPTDLPVGTDIEYRTVLNQKEYKKKAKYESDIQNHREPAVDKPIIYLYPEQEQEVNVSLSNPDSLTCSYPAYNGGWDVIASPDGSLKDCSSDRDLYALYYEAAVDDALNFEDGFVVKGQDSAAFLEEKLATLGLTDREAEEFIVYWLPKLEENEYNYIHFMTTDEINCQMGLDITPTPDSTIRVWMAFEGLDEPIQVEEQALSTPERDGFVAVEWGGCDIS